MDWQLPAIHQTKCGPGWGLSLRLLALTAALGGCASVTLSTQTSQPQQNTPEATITDLPDTTGATTIEPAATTQEITNDDPADEDQNIADAQDNGSVSNPAISGNPDWQLPPGFNIERIGQTGTLNHPKLTELSGLSASQTMPGVLFAINDSGNQPMVYALSETGEHLAAWTVDARNRDWEDLASATIDNIHYLVIGDTGDNLNTHKQARLLFVPETLFHTSNDTPIVPAFEIAFTYEDGPRNVEAFAISENRIFLISKESVNQSGPKPSHLYVLQIPDVPTTTVQLATKAATLPLARTSFESRMVAAITGVDLNHPTALDFDAASQTAYLLTYRHVLELKKRAGQSWSDALSSQPNRLHAHRLQQAEALAVTPGRAVWFSSEGAMAPLWAIPIDSPL